MCSIFPLLLLILAVAEALKHDDRVYHPIPNFLKDIPIPKTRNNILENLGPNKYTPEHEANAEYWLELARNEVQQRASENPLNLNRAKNIIFFVGIGMSLSTATAARIRKGQLKGNTGEEDALRWEKFPYFGLSKTYCVNAQVPDSACTSTAYLCGIKNNIHTLGVSAKVNYNNCSESENPLNHISSIAHWAQKAGKSTGFITTATLTHASVAGSYAHTANRFYESDADIPNSSEQCSDIAQQLISQEPGRNFDLMMGGGMGKFLPKNLKDLHGNQGQRLDGKNLLALWQGMHPEGALVHNRNALLNIDLQKVTNIMGLFETGPMEYHAKADKNKQPSLEEMTEIAIEFLSKNDRGYFVLIEASKIDRAHHENLAGVSLDETLEFERAVEKALNMTDSSETLIVVSSDHSNPLSFAGYPGRGTNILGVNQHDTDSNGIRYTTLNYAAGQQQYLDDQGKRLDIEQIFGDDIFAQYSSYIHTEYGVHAGDDVGIFAQGPYAHLFRGVMEQHAIPHLMAYASCIGNGPTTCHDQVE